MSCGVGHRRGSDPALLWLWYRPAAIALIQPLAWGPPYAEGAALKRPKKKKKNQTRREWAMLQGSRNCLLISNTFESIALFVRYSSMCRTS